MLRKDLDKMVGIPSLLDFDMVIKNGVVVTATDECRCDIGIKDGIIRVLADDIPALASATVIDADGGFITVSLLFLQTQRTSYSFYCTAGGNRCVSVVNLCWS